ncbi:unnamed protein product [Angiostrongylus costaricensis]|uniref:G_PROTEIN_RECEP_F1_2 domain-containing protein n=1 Tax=Angiostrongylus costaricensis TaxID=334426 RepID=A0A0R3PT98_ANGCS|nr:unnamed protein product [Angiostrongylus costaricensis]
MKAESSKATKRRLSPATLELICPRGIARAAGNREPKRNIQKIQQKSLCSENIRCFKTLAAWLLPSIFAAFFYYCVCKAVWMSRSKSQPHQLINNLKLKKSDVTQDYINRMRKKSHGHRRQNTVRSKGLRLTMTIIANNFFLWMPFCLVNMIQAFKLTVLMFTFTMLGNLNYCANPWLYILFNCSKASKALCGFRRMGFNFFRNYGAKTMLFLLFIICITYNSLLEKTTKTHSARAKSSANLFESTGSEENLNVLKLLAE